jgi:hypothetical protein
MRNTRARGAGAAKAFGLAWETNHLPRGPRGGERVRVGRPRHAAPDEDPGRPARYGRQLAGPSSVFSSTDMIWWSIIGDEFEERPAFPGLTMR